MFAKQESSVGKTEQVSIQQWYRMLFDASIFGVFEAQPNLASGGVSAESGLIIAHMQNYHPTGIKEN